jgi:hypothetical protein
MPWLLVLVGQWTKTLVRKLFSKHRKKNSGFGATGVTPHLSVTIHVVLCGNQFFQAESPRHVARQVKRS